MDAKLKKIIYNLRPRDEYSTDIIEGRQCQYVFGGSDQEDQFYCGRKTVKSGSPYCEEFPLSYPSPLRREKKQCTSKLKIPRIRSVSRWAFAERGYQAVLSLLLSLSSSNCRVCQNLSHHAQCLLTPPTNLSPPSGHGHRKSLPLYPPFIHLYGRLFRRFLQRWSRAKQMTIRFLHSTIALHSSSCKLQK